MKLNNDPIWDAISNIIIRVIVLMFGVYLITQPSTIIAIIGFVWIMVNLYSFSNYVNSLIFKNKKSKPKPKQNDKT